VSLDGDRAIIEGHVSTSDVDTLERRVPDLTSGLGVFIAEPDGYTPVSPA
jgi:hypothetical protein